jgi:hypothetical protein
MDSQNFPVYFPGPEKFTSTSGDAIPATAFPTSEGFIPTPNFPDPEDIIPAPDFPALEDLTTWPEDPKDGPEDFTEDPSVSEGSTPLGKLSAKQLKLCPDPIPHPYSLQWHLLSPLSRQPCKCKRSRLCTCLKFLILFCDIH